MDWKKRAMGLVLTGCLAVGMLAPTAMAADTITLPELPEQQLTEIGEKQVAGEALFTQTEAQVYQNGTQIGGYHYSYVYDKDNKVRQQTVQIYGLKNGKEVLGNSEVTYFTYNNKGMLSKAENDTETVIFTYDADGKLATEKYTDAENSEVNYEAVYKYNDEGVIVQADITYTDNVQAVAKYTYDSEGRLEKVAISAKGSDEVVTQTTYKYDDKGNVIEENEDGAITTYTYDENGNCTSESFTDDQYGTIKFAYTYQLTSEWQAQNPVQIDKVFSDVSAGAWYAKYVKSAYVNCLINGTSNTTFSPKAEMNRAMFVEILYNAAGCPDVKQGTTFTDVKQDAWYYNSVSWAQENNVTAGIGDGKFGPKDSVTRQQMANLLYNYVEDTTKAVDQTAAAKYPDYASVSTWAQNGVAWAVNVGAISGVKQGDVNYLAPKAVATRAEAATMLTEYFVK